jgi:pilus assembly protein CpaE
VTVERLRSRWPTTLIIVVAGGAEPDLILQAMRAGGNEFFAWPAGNGDPPDALKEGIWAAIRRTVERTGSQGEHSRTLSFFGAKGGVGTTTLAVNCAIDLVRECKQPTVIVDMNPFLGEVGLFLGVRPRFTILDALDNLQRLDSTFVRELVSKHKSGLDILAGSEQLERPSLQDAAGVDELIQILGRNYGYVVIDAGSLTHSAVDMAVFASDMVFLVANPDVPSIRNTQRLVDRLAQMGLADDRVQILLNRMSDRHVIAPKQLEQAVGRPVYQGFPSDYATVSAALNAGVPLAMSNSTEIASCFSEFSQRIVGLNAVPAQREKPRKHVLNLF